MAASAVNRRYISAVYEDKYFPEKNAAIPFKWETSPGRTRYDIDDDVDDYFEINATKDDDKQGSCVHQCMQESSIHTQHPHATIYPLHPPPKATPASPLRVKDLLVDGGMCANDLSNFEDDDQLQQLSPHDACRDLHTYRRSFSRLSIRFRSVKASTVVPIHKNHCAIKRSRNLSVDESQASRHVTHAPFRGRSQSFNHAAMHGATAAAKQGAANGINAVGDASMQVPGRRCNSFHLQLACHTGKDHACRKVVVDDDDDVDDDDPSSMAVAAVWAGACILAAAAAHDVVSADHHQHVPCRVAMKLRDLMQQSATFSELELPMKMMKLKKGGGSVIDESFAQLSLCHATTPAAAVAKRKPNSVEEEVMEAFLREGIKKSCTLDDDDIVEDESTKEKATLELGDDHSGKLVKRRSFLKVFKNECIACWCPTSTL